MLPQQQLTSILTSSTFSPCLFWICFRTNSGPLNFLPLIGHNHLSFANSCVFAVTNFSTSASGSFLPSFTTSSSGRLSCSDRAFILVSKFLIHSFTENKNYNFNYRMSTFLDGGETYFFRIFEFVVWPKSSYKTKENL